MSEGGPWGNQDEDATEKGGREGPRNPWTPPSRGTGGGGDGNRPGGDRGPSAIDEIIRRTRESFGGGLPQRPEGGRMWLYLALAVAVIWIAMTSFHSIGAKQRGVVTFLGSYSRTLLPGINPTLPAPFETVQVVDVGEIRTLDLGSAAGAEEKLMLTEDQNIINLGYSVRWDIRDPKLYAFQIADPDETLGEIAESAMRAVIATVSLSDAMGSGRNMIETQVQQRMQDILDNYGAGVRIQGVAIKQADPPDAVNDAFKDVTAAQQAAETYVNQAQAYAQQLSARSQGEAAAFDKVYEQYRLAPEVTRRRMYYETMEGVLGDVNKTIVETNGVTSYLPLPAVRPGTRVVPEAQQQGGGQ